MEEKLMHMDLRLVFEYLGLPQPIYMGSSDESIEQRYQAAIASSRYLEHMPPLKRFYDAWEEIDALVDAQSGNVPKELNVEQLLNARRQQGARMPFALRIAYDRRIKELLETRSE